VAVLRAHEASLNLPVSRIDGAKAAVQVIIAAAKVGPDNRSQKRRESQWKKEAQAAQRL